MIASPKTTAEGAAYGISLWFNKVLPVLLPFMIASGIIIRLGAFDSKSKALCIIYTAFIGLFCGFPMGAKLTADFYGNKNISMNEACFLLSFCNLPSPAFIISYTAVSCLKIDNILIFIIAFYTPIIILAPVSFIAYGLNKPEDKHKYNSLINNKCDDPKEHRISISIIEKSMTDSYVAIGKIGGYMIIFSIISAFIQKISMSPVIQSSLICILEMTTGINKAAEANIGIFIKVCLSYIALCTGAMSCIAQTAGVLYDTPISMTKYILWRILHAILSIIIYALFILFF